MQQHRRQRARFALQTLGEGDGIGSVCRRRPRTPAPTRYRATGSMPAGTRPRHTRDHFEDRDCINKITHHSLHITNLLITGYTRPF